MEIDVLTLFPRIFEGPLEESILKRAQSKGLVVVRVHNLRDFTHDKHRVVDDKPYGGGPGMLMKPEPIFEAVEKFRRTDSRVVLMTPQGSPLTQGRAQEFSRAARLIIICGHYEGVDERARAALVNDEVSIGDYVLTNGALAAAVFVDDVVCGRIARRSAVHAATRVSGFDGARGAVERQPRGDCQMARRMGAATDEGAAAGFVEGRLNFAFQTRYAITGE
jgi:tRNA (guanine-N1)-methyltransferase